MKQLEGQMSIFDIWAPKKYPGVQNIYEYVNHPDWMNADRRNEVEEWLIEHPEDIDSYKASKMLKRNEYPAIIKSLVSELIEMFGDDAISEPFTYDVWEHVPNLGARLFIVIDNQTQWDLTEIISRYKKVNLEIDPTECPGDEEGKEDIYISTMWTTPKHKENLGEAPKKHVKQCQDNVCKFSQHECNKDELWKVADSLDDIKCPHVCCRKCTVRCCGARCNGSVEPVGQCTDNVAQDEWINPDECLPEKSGYYFVRDVKGQEYKTWFELTTHGFNHGKNYAIEAWKAMSQEEKAVCPDGKWDKKCATCSQWHFNKYADCSCSHVDCKGPDYKSYDALIKSKREFPWNEFETEDGLNFPPDKGDWTVYEIIREYRQHNEQKLERIRYRNTTFIGLEKNPYPLDDNKILMWREVPEDEREWKGESK